MKKIYLFLILFLSACSSSEIKEDLNNSLNFSEDMDFEEFKITPHKHTTAVQAVGLGGFGGAIAPPP